MRIASALRFLIYGIALGAHMFTSVSDVYAQSDEVCHLVVDGDPMDLNGMVIDVPLSAVALDPNIQIFPPDVTVQGSSRVVSTIVFIIDDSGSMRLNDKAADRYTVTKEILDEIYKISPQTRVGVVAFRNWLAWDWRENDIFKKISSPFEWNDSYFPCVPLDTVYADGQRGIEKIKGLFELDQWKLLQAFQENDSTERTRPLDDSGVRLPKLKQGTDITLAFSAAKDALADSPTPRERQFCVFLSDGLHGDVDEEMESRQREYIQGEDVPTTFSIFMGDSIKETPEQLTNMISNIQNNGYSRANRNSQLWSVETTYDTLLALMQREILSEMFKPDFRIADAKIGGRTMTGSSDTSVFFDSPYPLNADTTHIHLSYTFSYVDSAKPKNSFDTLMETSFAFVRKASAGYDLFPPELGSNCFERLMVLKHEDRTIDSPIRSNQNSLVTDLTLEGINTSSFATVYNYDKSDSFEVNLRQAGDYFTGTFIQQASENIVQGDSVIQFTGIDSLVISWRNPDIPLDTMYRAWQVIPFEPVEITSVVYKDNNGDGLIDEIHARTNEQVNSQEKDNLYANRFVLPGHRVFSYKDARLMDDRKGFVIYVSQPSSQKDNSTGAGRLDSLRITEYVTGPFENYIEEGSYPITDGVAPVLLSVVYIPSRDPEADPKLQVRFSEAVKPITAERPFKFKTSEGQPYTLELEPINQNDSYVEFRVVSNSLNLTPSSTDSVWISEQASISDLEGNAQTEPNQKVPLTISFPEYEIQAAVIPNVVKVGSKNRLPQFGSGTGSVIVIAPDQFVRDAVRISKMDVKIFDSVGNLLADELPVRKNKGLIYMHWNGYNLNQRRVAAGTYLAVMRVETEIDGKKRNHTKTVKIGFKL